MKNRIIVLTCCLMCLCASILIAQVGPKPPKPNDPVNKTPIPDKPPPTFPNAKSDLSAGVSAYVDSQAGKVVMDAFVTNYGPKAISYGLRTVTFTARNKGTTFTFFKDEKIPALKGTATTPGRQAGSSFTLSHSVPISWGFDDSTVYEVKISPSKNDPKPKNDVANQVGPNKGKP